MIQQSRSKAFIPALIEKAKLLIHLNEWEQVVDTLERVKSSDAAKVSVAKIKIFQLLAREGARNQAVEEIKEFIKLVDSHEPKNPDLYYKASQLFARVTGGNEVVLQKTMDLLKKSILLNPNNSLYNSELAYQLTLLQDYVKAFSVYQKSAEMDETNVEPLYGMIYCRLKQNLLEDIESQLEFLIDLEGGTKTAFHTFLEAILIFKRDKQIENSIEMLNNCLKYHIAEAKRLPIGFDFYIKLNSAFLLELSQEYLQHCSPGVKFPNPESQPPYLIKGIKLLETLTRQTPGIIEAHMMLAKAKWITNEVSAAQTALNTCMTMAPDDVEPYILSAQLFKEDGNLTGAFRSLENALAENFTVRDHPFFMYTLSLIHISEPTRPLYISYAVFCLKKKKKKQKQKIKRPQRNTTNQISVY
eukprot:TRINITY_DN9773_c0_g1_i2.p1 TRINITY_DN9773_c0_g1~~TRINITY_DN9773_c0_g1_i2.p1  ORF type:complete len:415 (+),score=70.66 TRINITY_DN9773_c0_g1_i2:840-2084(+)